MNETQRRALVSPWRMHCMCSGMAKDTSQAEVMWVVFTWITLWSTPHSSSSLLWTTIMVHDTVWSTVITILHYLVKCPQNYHKTVHHNFHNLVFKESQTPQWTLLIISCWMELISASASGVYGLLVTTIFFWLLASQNDWQLKWHYFQYCHINTYCIARNFRKTLILKMTSIFENLIFEFIQKMVLLKYGFVIQKWSNPASLVDLPNTTGTLSKSIPSSTIKAANTAVREAVLIDSEKEEPDPKRGRYQHYNGKEGLKSPKEL